MAERVRVREIDDVEGKRLVRIERLYAIADGEAEPGVVVCLDEFGPLNLHPRPGRA